MKTRKLTLLLASVMFGALIVFVLSCKKKETGPPVLTTTAVSGVTQSTAVSGGNITDDGGSDITARGVCWNTIGDPTTSDAKTSDGTGSGSFTSNISGLNPKMTYYVRAYATNENGTSYGSSVSFMTDGVTDIDGNIYHTVTIGTQVWLQENLKVTHYRNGDPITNVTDAATWAGLTTEAYCDYYNDQIGYGSTYGCLYNWYAVTDSRNIAPAGWHVPTDAEWLTLVDYLGGYFVAGGKMKETGTTHWNVPNTGATNSSGFTARGAGHRLNDGSFYSVLDIGIWWSKTQMSGTNAYYRVTYYNNANCPQLDFPKKAGLSVRCVKD